MCRACEQKMIIAEAKVEATKECARKELVEESYHISNTHQSDSLLPPRSIYPTHLLQKRNTLIRMRIWMTWEICGSECTVFSWRINICARSPIQQWESKRHVKQMCKRKCEFATHLSSESSGTPWGLNINFAWAEWITDGRHTTLHS